MPHRFDFLVLGSGVAGLSFALQAARHGSVAVLCKREPQESNTAYAQGGIASVLSPTDSFEAHIRDTLEAGAGLNHLDAVEVTVREGPERIRELVTLGADFNRRASGEFDLTREGGHSERRIVHSGDITGREVQRALLGACAAQPNITFFPNTAAIDLILDRRKAPGAPGRCLGVYALMPSGHIESFLGKSTVLATGGAGKVYLYTSNPDVATGDGVAMAHRAGAAVANMEFYQFHPTCLFHPEAKSFLISEALRGEGGKLRLRGGAPFMDRYHRLGELAPRDVVALAIDAELKRTGDDCVYLDMTHLGRAYLMERFPNIYATCKAFNIDMAVQPIPVVPAAHYMCGGVVTDLHGRTTLPGLFAIGEVAHTGLHGANRLASNSLLEGLVFGHRAAAACAEEVRSLSSPPEDPPDWDEGSAVASDESVVVTHNWDEIRRLMWNYVGIVRTDKRLMRARRRLELLREEIRDYYWRFKVTQDVIELRNICEVATLIVDCASRRKESRGLHYTLDYPGLDDHARQDTVVRRAL
ncbi:L-aspartate oxidase [Melittangium boletus]|uniref:L-aspartate oxidase n=1 Tax=Melittangium boletus TaxID=83453 RepID=UPI003DA576DC